MNNYIQHHGIKGQKWGIRRYQNKDGTLTAAGKKRAEKQEAKIAKKEAKAEARAQRKLQFKQDMWEYDVKDSWLVAYNKAADEINSKMNDFNKEWDEKGVDFDNPKSDSYKAYTKAYCDLWNDIYTKQLDATFGKAPIDNGKAWCERVPMFINPEDL